MTRTPFFRADCSLPHTQPPSPQRNTAIMSSATTHEPTEITSPQRPGIRRGPRVSNACVNCRRRKVGSSRPVRPTSAVWRLTTSCVVGEMHRRQTTMPVLHDLSKALRLRGARQTPKVSSPFAVDGLAPSPRTLRLTRLTTQTNPRPCRAAGGRTPPAQGLNLSVAATG